MVSLTREVIKAWEPQRKATCEAGEGSACPPGDGGLRVASAACTVSWALGHDGCEMLSMGYMESPTEPCVMPNERQKHVNTQ